MSRFSKELIEYQQKWMGRRVVYQGTQMQVVGVGDDGAQCDYDQRRKFKPNGVLFLRGDDGLELMASEHSVSCISNKINRNKDE